MSKDDDVTIIGKIAPGTTVTQTMIDMMLADKAAGRPPATYMDGESAAQSARPVDEIRKSVLTPPRKS